MAGSIKLTNVEYIRLMDRLKAEYTPDVLLISWVLKRELGFTIRRHKVLVDGQWLTEMHLDFYDDAKKTFFILKYL